MLRSYTPLLLEESTLEAVSELASDKRFLVERGLNPEDGAENVLIRGAWVELNNG